MILNTITSLINIYLYKYISTGDKMLDTLIIGIIISIYTFLFSNNKLYITKSFNYCIFDNYNDLRKTASTRPFFHNNNKIYFNIYKNNKNSIMLKDTNNNDMYAYKINFVYVPVAIYGTPASIYYTPLYYNSLYNCFIYITFYNDGSINLTTNNNFEALHHFIDIIAPTLNNEESKKQQLQIYSLKKDNTSKNISFQSYAYVSPKKIFDTFFFTDKEKIINIVTKFKNNTLYSPNISIDNKLGLFLYGPPGTGKTGLISAIANYLNYDIIIINFQTNYTIPEFDYLFNKNNYTNKIIVFDEIDHLITKLDKYNKDVSSTNLIEQEVKMKSIANNTQELDTHITIEYILSKLDGVEDNNGRIICATTNKHELFEPRFFRPGRFDLVINLNNCTQQMYIDIICNFFSQSITLEDKEYINQIVYPELKYSPTELHNICIQSGDLNSAIKYIIDT